LHSLLRDSRGFDVTEAVRCDGVLAPSLHRSSSGPWGASATAR